MYHGKKWLKNLDAFIDEHLDNHGLRIEAIASYMKVSPRQLFRKVKTITGFTPKIYLRRYRMLKARQFMQAGIYRTVHETSKAVGYSNTSYFIKQFEKQFGVKPLQILQESGWR